MAGLKPKVREHQLSISTLPLHCLCPLTPAPLLPEHFLPLAALPAQLPAQAGSQPALTTSPPQEPFGYPQPTRAIQPSPGAAACPLTSASLSRAGGLPTGQPSYTVHGAPAQAVREALQEIAYITSTCCAGSSNSSFTSAFGYHTYGSKQLLSFLTPPEAGLLS